jgi:hypothetical protein
MKHINISGIGPHGCSNKSRRVALKANWYWDAAKASSPGDAAVCEACMLYADPTAAAAAQTDGSEKHS